MACEHSTGQRTTYRFLLRLGLVTAGLTGALLPGELLARALAPREPTGIAAIYRASRIPGVQYTLIPSLDTEALGADLRTNALGFRGPRWHKRKAPGTLRIALIGDSHAFGFGVPYDETTGEILAQILRQRLHRPVEVLDFAISGFNSRQQLAVLRHLALGFAPDVVILVPCNNDDEPAAFASLAGHLVPRASDATAPALASDTVRRSALVALLRRATAQIVAKPLAEVPPPQAVRSADTPWMGPFDDGDVPERLDAAVGQPLREMVRLSHRAGARVVLAPFAGPVEWRRLFRRVAREQGTELVELLALFPEARSWDDLLVKFGLGWNPHLGPTAHRRWAYALADVLDGAGRPATAPSS